ncbi:MAG: hypothetical protein IIW39_02455, partial [Clostridia bacterium]|nr:hypothetical protein [Clostridia bacterium]
MKKRAFTFALSLLLVFVLFACDTAVPTDESSEDASSCAESVCSTVEEPVYKVVFFRGETFSEEAAANALRSNYYRAEAFEDSPLLEQNLWLALDEIKLPAGEGSEGDAEFNGILLMCDNFTFELFGKKKDAIAIAEKIIEEMPEGLSPIESAKHFYKILGRNTTYDIGE